MRFKCPEAEARAGVNIARRCACPPGCAVYAEALELVAPMILSMEKEGLLGGLLSVLRGGKDGLSCG